MELPTDCEVSLSPGSAFQLYRRAVHEGCSRSWCKIFHIVRHQEKGPYLSIFLDKSLFFDGRGGPGPMVEYHNWFKRPRLDTEFLCSVLEQDVLSSPSYWLTLRKQWLCPDMTEK